MAEHGFHRRWNKRPQVSALGGITGIARRTNLQVTECTQPRLRSDDVRVNKAKKLSIMKSGIGEGVSRNAGRHAMIADGFVCVGGALAFSRPRRLVALILITMLR